MLELKTPKERANAAHNLAGGLNLVRYRNMTYMPCDYETGWPEHPDPDRTIWMPLDRDTLRRTAAKEFKILFGSDGELASFEFMVAQNSTEVLTNVTSLLVKTPDGLRQLDEMGHLQEVTGEFVPNTILPMLNEDAEAKAKVLSVVTEWVDSEEEARSLLRHLATSLAPGWSAVKYVLLLGEGRNGKSVLLEMMSSLFGKHNVSSVTRQNIAEANPVVLDLNGKLVNIVFDGKAKYLEDSGMEKSLVAGEAVSIRRLYESTGTPVQTNALFIEGLNKEPKSNDKSTALQKRLVRFLFPNVYPLNHKFRRMMLSEEMLGAFLALLIEHYVREDEVAEKLAPTTRAIELQLEHMYINSIALQFLKHIEETDPLGVESLVGESMAVPIQLFQSWRVKENDLGNWAEPDVQAQLLPLLHTERRSVRENGKIRKQRFVTGLKVEAQAFIDTLNGEEEDADDQTTALVED